MLTFRYKCQLPWGDFSALSVTALLGSAMAVPNINPPLLSGVCNPRRLLILQVKEQREIFTQNIVHTQKWMQPGLTSTLAWFQGTGYFFQTLVSPEAVLGHSHLRVGLNVTKSLQTFCHCASGHSRITLPA